MITFAAVDIGSNAIRVNISNLLAYGNSYEFKTVEYLRVPLRLGEDVFTIGKLSETKIEKLLKLAQSLMNLFELYEVKKYLACATSAFREAQNQVEVINLIRNNTGFNIQVIDGNMEAEWTNHGLAKLIEDGTWLHVDVGGGSTEINIYRDRIKVASHSFRIGAVRVLMKEDVFEAKKELIEWVLLHTKDAEEVQAIGTGGNIRKLHELAQIPSKKPLKTSKITELMDFIGSYSLQERVNILKLNPDRADVILPSSDIYLTVLQAAKAQCIYVPKVGLTDGIFEIMRTSLIN